MLITLNDIDKYYASGFSRTYVLRNINLEVQEGEFISIMGPSGSGKSTLLNIIGLLEQPSDGEYFFLDKPVHKIKDSEKSELHKNFIGFVFQSYHLIDELTVSE